MYIYFTKAKAVIETFREWIVFNLFIVLDEKMLKENGIRMYSVALKTT